MDRGAGGQVPNDPVLRPRRAREGGGRGGAGGRRGATCAGLRAEFYLSEFERHPDYTSGVRLALNAIGDRALLITNSTHDDVLVANRGAHRSLSFRPCTRSPSSARTAIEAMATRCAVVYSRRGGLPEVVGETGVGIDEVSARAIGGALDRLVEIRRCGSRSATKPGSAARAFSISARRRSTSTISTMP